MILYEHAHNAHLHTHGHMKTPCTHMILHDHEHTCSCACTWPHAHMVLHEHAHMITWEHTWSHARACTWSHAHENTYVQTNTHLINNKIFLKSSKQREFYINATPKDKWFPEYLKSLSFIQIQPNLSMSGSTGRWIWAMHLARFSTNLLKDAKEAFK